MNTKSFDPDVQDGSGWTPLMIACSLKDGTGESIVDLLLQKDADVNMQSFSGQTALHFASSKDNLDIARKLIAQKASARVKDKRGQLALHRAAAAGSVPILRLLLENRSPVNGTDMDGMTALHHAISEGHGQAALELLKAGAETDKEDVDGRRAIDMAPDSKVSLHLYVSSETRSKHETGAEFCHARSRERRYRPVAFTTQYRMARTSLVQPTVLWGIRHES
jgi:26S proteasome non-ATPase regulatory subunit 10